MMIMESPSLRALEVTKVVDFVTNCETLEDTAVATKLVDLLQSNQPDEKEVISSLRNLICDMSFQFYLEKYPVK